MTRCDLCNRDRLQRLLDESLPEAVEKDVSEHVASCPACQVELEALAAGRAWWNEASQRLSSVTVGLASSPSGFQSELRDDSSNAGSEEEGRAGSPSSGEASHEDEASHFAADFAVDFLEPSDDSAMLGRLGKYEICEVIGRGGMGVVLKGFQKELHRYVAVKVLAPHLATSGAARRRFAREAQATAAIVNPHVMAIHSVNANTKLPYLVMPFVACESLQQRLDQHGPLDVKDVLRIGMQAALGLAAAHAQGLVHRDVKPANILLETNVDRVMLTDFGLARAVDDATLTRTGIIAGTPQYMSPEQANGDAVDHRSDLFSLGSVLYAMCTARPPFRAETTFGVLRRIRETPPRAIREINADIPEWLERIVMKLLSKDASERIATATEVASLLEQCLAHVQQPTTVALPESSHLAPRDDSRTSGNTRTATDRQAHSWLRRVIGFPLAEREGYFVRATVATLLIAGVVVFTIWSRTKPVPHESNRAAPTASVTHDPLLEWGGIQTELDATAKAIEPLEADAKRDLEAFDLDQQKRTNSNRKEEP
ncbi:MAG: serine/threonine-protein kinase [Planctomycetota bacterium]